MRRALISEDAGVPFEMKVEKKMAPRMGALSSSSLPKENKNQENVPPKPANVESHQPAKAFIPTAAAEKRPIDKVQSSSGKALETILETSDQIDEHALEPVHVMVAEEATAMVAVTPVKIDAPPLTTSSMAVPEIENTMKDQDATSQAEAGNLEEEDHYYAQFLIATRLLMKEKRAREREAKEANLKILQLDKQRLQAEEKMNRTERESASAKAHIEAKYQAQIKSLQSRIRTITTTTTDQNQGHIQTQKSSRMSLNSSALFSIGSSFRRRQSISASKSISSASTSSSTREEALQQRIQELEHDLVEQTSLVSASKEKCSAYLDAAVQSESALSLAQNELVELRYARSKLERKILSLKSEKERLESHIEDLIFKGGSVAEQLQQIQDQLAAEVEKNEKLEEELEAAIDRGNGQTSTQSQQIYALQREIRDLKERTEQHGNTVKLYQTSISSSTPSSILIQQISQLQGALKIATEEKAELKGQLEASRKRAFEAEKKFQGGNSADATTSHNKVPPTTITQAPKPPALPNGPLTLPLPRQRSSKRISSLRLSVNSGEVSMKNPAHCSAIAELVMLKAKQRQARISKLDTILQASPSSAAKTNTRKSMGRKQGPLTLQQIFSSAMALRRPNIEQDDDDEEASEDGSFSDADNELEIKEPTKTVAAAPTSAKTKTSSKSVSNDDEW